MGAYASEKITIDNTAGGVGFTATLLKNGIVNKAYEASFRVETAQFRYTTDGSAPTTTVGILAEIGDFITITGESDINRFKGIRTGGTSAVIQPHYFDDTE